MIKAPDDTDKEKNITHSEKHAMNRRNFIKATTLSAVGLSLAQHAHANTTQKENNMDQVKFCAFADIHFYPGVFPHDSFDWLDRILERATRQNVDFIIHAGDMTHHPKKEIKYVNYYNDFKIPTYHTLGNHDHDGNSFEETLEAYRLTSGYHYFDKNGFRFIATDTNNCKVDDGFIHYTNSNYYKLSTDWIPPAQLEWLKHTIETSPYPCILTSHSSFERESGGVKNFMDVRKIINDANAKKPGQVRMCINGHHHRDNIRILDNVIYFDLNSANYEWVNKAHDLYPQSVMDKWKLAKNTVMYNDPISAIITMKKDGTVIIDGATSSMFMGITREMTGNSRCDGSGRPVSPVVQSLNIKMNY